MTKTTSNKTTVAQMAANNGTLQATARKPTVSLPKKPTVSLPKEQAIVWSTNTLEKRARKWARRLLRSLLKEGPHPWCREVYIGKSSKQYGFSVPKGEKRLFQDRKEYKKALAYLERIDVFRQLYERRALLGYERDIEAVLYPHMNDLRDEHTMYFHGYTVLKSCDQNKAEGPWDHDSEFLVYNAIDPRKREEVIKELQRFCYNDFRHLSTRVRARVKWSLFLCERCGKHTMAAQVPTLQMAPALTHCVCKDCYQSGDEARCDISSSSEEDDSSSDEEA